MLKKNKVPHFFHHRYFRYSLLFILLTTIVALYLPGNTGAFYYDDLRPLGALKEVTDVKSALIYIFSETSGPLGRSLSMVSFLFNVSDWPSTASTGNTTAFFTFNIILHVLNGLIVFGLSYFIASLYRGTNRNNYWLALGTCAFWLVLPMHVSTSLIVIQRMAGLSAFFVFSGLLLYVYGLHKQNQWNQASQQFKNSDGLTFQLLGLVLFTFFAMFSKENGVLLPVFVLVLETTLLVNVVGIQYRRKLRITACIAGLLLLLTYLTYKAISTGNVISGRDFTLVERLVTQPQVLLDYLKLSFIPNVTAFTPFHDNYKHVTHLFDSPKAMLAIILLGLSFISALFYRRKYPLFSFAVFWFLVAHLIESSVIALELYFEHRNYVALFGVCLAIVFALAKVPLRYKKMMLTSIVIYWLLLAFVLSMTTQLWGNPQQAAKIWQTAQPNSIRAADNLSAIYLKEKNIIEAQKLWANQVEISPDSVNSQVQALLFSCYAGFEQQTKYFYQKIYHHINTTTRANNASSILGQLYKLIDNKYCSAITLSDLKKLNTAFLLQLPESPFNKKTLFLQNLYVFAITEKNITEAIRLLYLAWYEQQQPIIANELVSTLLIEKEYQQAEEFINNHACQSMPFNPILAKNKLKHCNSLVGQVNKARGKVKN